MRKTVRCYVYEGVGPTKYVPIADTEDTIPNPYDPSFGDERLCVCATTYQSTWHVYRRHFDTYEDMRPVGCKYCGCLEFSEDVLSSIEAGLKAESEGRLIDVKDLKRKYKARWCERDQQWE